MHIQNFALFGLFVEYVRHNMPELSMDDSFNLCYSQYPIVEQALHYGEGIRACTARAHDVTCQFVERQLMGPY